MQRVCIRCRQVVGLQFLCPECGLQTVEADEFGRPVGGALQLYTPFRPNLIARLAAGVLIALGLVVAWHCFGSAFLESGTAASWWRAGFGRGVSIAIQVVALLIAGGVIGAGHAMGASLGGVVGLAFAVIQLLHVGIKPEIRGDWLLWSALVGDVVAGAVGGLIGLSYWTPVPRLKLLAPISRVGEERLVTAIDVDDDLPHEVVPTQWLRVMMGAAIIGAGVAVSNPAKDFVVRSGGFLDVSTEFIAWMVVLITTIAGGGFAGARTKAGTRQGFLASFLAVPAVIAIYHQKGGAAPVSDVLLTIWNVNVPPGVPALAATAVQTLMFGTTSGYVFSQLYPPEKARRLDSAAA